MEKYEHLTLLFKIEDKDKFRSFHKTAFPIKKEETEDAIRKFGGYAVVSSWSDPFEENTNLEKALEFALQNLYGDEREICELISKGHTEEEARRIYESEE